MLQTKNLKRINGDLGLCVCVCVCVRTHSLVRSGQDLSRKRLRAVSWYVSSGEAVGLLRFRQRTMMYSTVATAASFTPSNTAGISGEMVYTSVS